MIEMVIHMDDHKWDESSIMELIKKEKDDGIWR